MWRWRPTDLRARARRGPPSDGTSGWPQALGDRRACAALPELSEIGSQVGARGASPIDAARVEPVEIRADRGRVRALGVRRRVARGEGPEEASEGRRGRAVEGDPAHASAAGSAGPRPTGSRRPGRLAAPPRSALPPRRPAEPPSPCAGHHEPDERSPRGSADRREPVARQIDGFGQGIVGSASGKIAASPLRAMGPSSVSCRPPSGSSLVV